MKTKLFISLIFVFTLFTNCSKTNDNTEEAINVPWSLKSVVGGLIGANNIFEMGTVLWTFNDDNNTLLVINNNSENVYDGLETGTYNYNISTIDGLDYLIIDNDYNLGQIEFLENEFILDDGIALDGLLLTFETYIP